MRMDEAVQSGRSTWEQETTVVLISATHMIYTKPSPKQVLCSHLSTRIRARPNRFAPWLDRSTTPYRTNTAMGHHEVTYWPDTSRVDAGTIGFQFQCTICTCSSARRGREISRSIENHRFPGAHAPLHAHRSGGTSGRRLPPSRSLLSDKKVLVHFTRAGRPMTQNLSGLRH